MGFSDLLKEKHVLLIGTKEDAEIYGKALKNTGADVIHLDEDINWQDQKFANRAAGSVLHAAPERKPDAVVVVSPDLSTERERLKDPIYKFANSMRQQKVPLVVLDTPTVGQGMKRFLEGQGIQYMSALEEMPHDLPGAVFVEIKEQETPGHTRGFLE